MDVICLPSELQRLVEKLNQEEKLKANIVSLVSEGKEVAKLFLVLINDDGMSVIQNEKLLSLVDDLKEVDVQSCKKILSKFKEGLFNIRNKLIMLQKIVHQKVEDCREVKQNYERTICEKQKELEDIDERVQVTEKSIKQYEKSASEYEQTAITLDESSDESTWRSVGNAGAGIIGGAFAIFVGAAFAPVTGGASISIGCAAAGLNAGVNGANVVVNVSEAMDLAEKARRARNRAHTAECERNKLVDEKSALSSEIGPLQLLIDKSKSQVKTLKALEIFLNRCIDSVDIFQTNAETVDAVIVSVSSQTDTFSIAQKISIRRNNDYEFGQKMLTEIKSKWSTLATSISELQAAGDQKRIEYH